MSCRDEILETVNALVKDRMPKIFRLHEVVRAMQANHTRYSDSTIRTHVAALMCQDNFDTPEANDGHFERVAYGTYRVL